MSNAIKVGSKRFVVDEDVPEKGSYLVSFAEGDTEMKKWAHGMGLEVFRDPLPEADIVQWSIVCDRKTVALFKLTWGGA